MILKNVKLLKMLNYFNSVKTFKKDLKCKLLLLN